MAEPKFIVRDENTNRVFDSTDAYPGFPVMAYTDLGNTSTSYLFGEYVGLGGVIVYISPTSDGVNITTGSGYPQLNLSFANNGKVRSILVVLI